MQSTNATVRHPPMLAPGRRKLFVDRWNDYRRKLAGKSGCLPWNGVADADGRHLVEAATQWRKGCEAASLFEHAEALRYFDAAIALAPQGRAYPLARVLARAALRRWPEMKAA